MSLVCLSRQQYCVEYGVLSLLLSILLHQILGVRQFRLVCNDSCYCKPGSMGLLRQDVGCQLSETPPLVAKTPPPVANRIEVGVPPLASVEAKRTVERQQQQQQQNDQAEPTNRLLYSPPPTLPAPLLRFVGGYHMNHTNRKSLARDARVSRPPVDVVDLWCLQAEATLSFMAEKEQALGDLSLAIPFFLLEAWFDLVPCFFWCGFCAIFRASAGLVVVAFCRTAVFRGLRAWRWSGETRVRCS